MAMSVTYATVNGMLVMENRGGVKTEYISDTLGNLIQCRDMSGNKTYEAWYWSYGEVRESTGTNPSPWGFVGTLGYYTDALNYLYVRARYYRPNLTRWQTVDPLWSDEQAFGYVDQNPIYLVDASGLGPACSCKPTKLLGVKRTDPFYACYLKVCQWYSTVCTPSTTQADCSGFPSCKGLNDSLPPCLPSNPCYSECWHTGGNPTPGGGQWLPDWCCVECQIRVCCSIECPQNNSLQKILQHKFSKCKNHRKF